MIGETLGHYRIASRIGEGGMGAVYCAEDLKLHREVALKLLPPDLAGDSERFDRFQREARAVAALNHPNIVTLFSVEEDAGRHFLTMELVKGQSLNRVIPKGGLGIKEFLELAIPLADALAAAHAKGITHRDLKPANVMIDGGGRVKVIDFGLAKAVAGESSTDLSQAPTEQLTVEGRILGTPAYMSPEQVEGRQVDHRTDIFSLGILFHEMLLAERPFKGESNMAVMSAVLKDTPSSISSLRPEVPAEISRVIRRCLQKNPIERIQSALDVRNELKELQKEFLSGTLTSLSQARSTMARRGMPKGRIAIGVAVIVLGIAIGVWLLLPERDWRLADGGRRSGPSAAAMPLGIPQIRRLTTTDRLEAMPTFSPDGRRIAFVAVADGFKQIFIRELEGGATTQLTRGDYDHIQPAWGPDTNTMYYARSIKSGVTIGVGDAKVGAYITQQSSVVRHDLTTGVVATVAEEAAYPTVAPGGRELFFVYGHPYRIYKSDLNGSRRSQLSEDVDQMQHAEPRVSADGSRVVFRRFNVSERKHHLAIVNTNHVMTIVRTNGASFAPTWHPSGALVYFSMYRGAGQNIWRLPVREDNTAAGEPEPVTMGGGSDVEPAFSPDGRRMIFSVTSLNADIYRVSIDPVTGKTNGPPAEPMPFNSNREDSRASWAPSIEHPMIAFNSDRDGDMNLYIWREKGNSVTRVTTGPGGDYQATWSPDLKQLAFFSSRSGNAEIYVVGTNANSMPVRLTDSPGLDLNPFFSPDGKQIVFASERDGPLELYVMNADGSNQRRLVSNAGISHFHPWYDAESVLNPVRVDGVLAYYRIFAKDGRIEKVNTVFPIPSIGGHGSFSPDRKRFMELNYPHTDIWVISLTSNEGSAVYRPPNPSATIDYPWWSPDGRWATFDMSLPRNSELLMAEWGAGGGTSTN